MSDGKSVAKADEAFHAPAQRAPVTAKGGNIHGLVPTNIEEAYRIATIYHAAGLAGGGLDSPEKIMIAVMTGLDLGIPPSQAVAKIAVINNRPVMWGDALIGVVRASPQCLWVQEGIDGTGDDMVAWCETQRRGEPRPVVRRFSVEDAKRARLWSPDAKVMRWARGGQSKYEADNDSPWHRYPQRMLQMRARAWCLRDVYADVLSGIGSREEEEDLARTRQAAQEAEVIRAPQRPSLSERLAGGGQGPREAQDGFSAAHVAETLDVDFAPVDEGEAEPEGDTPPPTEDEAPPDAQEVTDAPPEDEDASLDGLRAYEAALAEASTTAEAEAIAEDWSRRLKQRGLTRDGRRKLADRLIEIKQAGGE
ncbi:hypothetical protein ATO13_22336 [Stappia sp. 22II-S9-Z10]|nr:hypothetical protein ATO13_22336 [Stappia sp. 22II-S9-Z10]